jgi:hypothetical protein
MILILPKIQIWKEYSNLEENFGWFQKLHLFYIQSFGVLGVI